MSNAPQLPQGSILEQAATDTAEAEVSLVKEKCSTLRTLLTAYEEDRVGSARQRVVAKMLTSVGIPVPPSDVNDGSLRAVTVDLRAALQVVWDLVSDKPIASPTSQVVLIEDQAPDSEIEEILAHAVRVGNENAVVLKPVPDPGPPRILRPDDIEAAGKLILEVDFLSQPEKQPVPRLVPLLQAFTAEARFYLNRIPQSHPMHRSLIDIFRTISQIKMVSGMSAYIKGLSRDAQGDWENLALISRRAVARFDADAAVAPSKARPAPKTETPKAAPKEKSQTIVEVTKKTVAPPSASPYPRLVEMTKENPIVLIGGYRIPEKVTYIKSLGIECDWHEIQKDSPRTVDSIVSRIQGRKLKAVLILEHFMTHSTFENLRRACHTTHTPYVHGGKGGKGAIELALRALEMRLAN